MSFLRKSFDFLLGAIFLSACAHKIPSPEPLPIVYPVRTLPHPESYRPQAVGATLRAIEALPLFQRVSPRCFLTVEKIRSQTTGDQKRFRKAVAEWVRIRPFQNHRCFYRKVFELVSGDKGSRQEGFRKRWLTEVQRLLPVAQAFDDEYGDGRYLDGLRRYYVANSAEVLNRRVVQRRDPPPSPKVDGTAEKETDELPEPTDTVSGRSGYGLWKKPLRRDRKLSVLEELGLVKLQPGERVPR